MIEELQAKADTPIGEITIPNRDWKKPNLIYLMIAKVWPKLFPNTVKSRTFTLYKCRMCNLDRAGIIAETLPDLNGDINTLEDLTSVLFPLAKKHTKDKCYLLACFIHNKSTEPPKWLIKYIYDNIDGDDLFEYIRLCLTQGGLMSFINATLLIRGTSARIVEAVEEKDAQSAITQA